MIRIIVLYLAIGLLLVTKYGWDEVIRLREEEHLSKPELTLSVIGSCFVTPICFVIGVVLGLIDLILEI